MTDKISETVISKESLNVQLNVISYTWKKLGASGQSYDDKGFTVQGTDLEAVKKVWLELWDTKINKNAA